MLIDIDIDKTHEGWPEPERDAKWHFTFFLSATRIRYVAPISHIPE
mgnify:FL=1